MNDIGLRYVVVASFLNYAETKIPFHVAPLAPACRVQFRFACYVFIFLCCEGA